VRTELVRGIHLPRRMRPGAGTMQALGARRRRGLRAGSWLTGDGAVGILYWRHDE
jgi:hypothetical protein